jgi:hypothetical protein
VCNVSQVRLTELTHSVARCRTSISGLNHLRRYKAYDIAAMFRRIAGLLACLSESRGLPSETAPVCTVEHPRRHEPRYKRGTPSQCFFLLLRRYFRSPQSFWTRTVRGNHILCDERSRQATESPEASIARAMRENIFSFFFNWLEDTGQGLSIRMDAETVTQWMGNLGPTGRDEYYEPLFSFLRAQKG